VDAINLDRKVITASHCSRCEPYELAYDQLVLAPGSRTNFFGLPGVAEHVFPMKTLADALALRNHVIDVLEHADIEPNPERRRPLCTMVVAGGGLAGVETIAELNDFTRRAQRFYPHIRPEALRMVLVHPGERLMPEINAQLAAYAQQQLTRRRMKVRLNTKIVRASADAVELSDGTTIPSNTLVWTAGTSVHPLVAALPAGRTSGGGSRQRVPRSPRLSRSVGGGGLCPYLGPQDWSASSAHGAACGAEGRHASRNIARQSVGAKRPFVFATLGQLVPLGRRSAVADILGWRFHGFFAWWLWRTIYLCKLPGFERKVRVALDWTLDLFFPATSPC
jgi:NADH dehydrogenase